MSLSSPRIVFGVHSLSPYSRTDHTPFGILTVIGSASIALSAPLDQLFGGAQRFAWAAESKFFNAELTAKVKAYPGFLYTQFLGATSTDNAAEAGGSVASMTNSKGTSVVAATGLLAAPTIQTAADVKFAKFVVKATDATHVDVYLMSDVDIARGTTGTYQNDALKITAAPLLITTGGSTLIPSFGINLVGGAGAIGFTAGDTAYFSSRPINTTSSDIDIGKGATTLPAFGAVILAQKRATAEMFEIEAYNCVGSGFPTPMAEMAFSETDCKVALLYDSVQDKTFSIRSVNPSTFT